MLCSFPSIDELAFACSCSPYREPGDSEPATLQVTDSTVLEHTLTTRGATEGENNNAPTSLGQDKASMMIEVTDPQQGLELSFTGKELWVRNTAVPRVFVIIAELSIVALLVIVLILI